MPPGNWKLVLFNMLKLSARNCKLVLSVILKDLNSEMSALKKWLGPDHA